MAGAFPSARFWRAEAISGRSGHFRERCPPPPLQCVSFRMCRAYFRCNGGSSSRHFRKPLAQSSLGPRVAPAGRGQAACAVAYGNRGTPESRAWYRGMSALRRRADAGSGIHAAP
ncbi:unnamed protein product [Caretta caretta]